MDGLLPYEDLSLDLWVERPTPSPSGNEELGPETHTQVVHECHPLLAGLIEERVYSTYISFFQLAGSAPGKKEGRKEAVIPDQSPAMKTQKCNGPLPASEQSPGSLLFGLL